MIKHLQQKDYLLAIIAPAVLFPLSQCYHTSWNYWQDAAP